MNNPLDITEDDIERFNGWQAAILMPMAIRLDVALRKEILWESETATDADGSWNPDGGHNGCGYWLPKGWQRTEPDPRVLDNYEPGDALGMVCDHKLDGVDTDVRNGGDESRAALEAEGAMPRTYGRATTPSGGTHELVATMGIRSRDNVLPGLDVKAGAPDGQGRGFLFIAPTRIQAQRAAPEGHRAYLPPL